MTLIINNPSLSTARTPDTEGEKTNVADKQTKYEERNKSDDDDSESNNYYDVLYESDDDDSESSRYDDIEYNRSCDDRPKNNEDLSLEQKIRKAAVAAGGGALVLLGICLTPVPIIPIGMPTIGVGLHVLAKEFEDAKRAEQKLIETMNCIRDKLSEEFMKHHSQIEDSMELRRNELRKQGELIL